MNWYFTEKEKEYIKEHYTSKTIYQIAIALGRRKSSVGYHLQTVLGLKVPAAVYAQNKANRKTDALLRHATKPVKEKKHRIKKEKIKVVKCKKQIYTTHYRKDVIQKSSVIKIPDHSNLIPLRINAKTILYIKPGADINLIVKQFDNLAIKRTMSLRGTKQSDS